MLEGQNAFIKDTWTDAFAGHARAMCTLLKTHIARQSLHEMQNKERETLWNAFHNVSFLSSELGSALNLPPKKRTATPTKKRKKKKQQRPAPVKKRKRTRRKTVVEGGYCDGCERCLTGAEVVSWRRGDALGYDETAKRVTYARLCNKCGLKRIRRNRLRKVG